MKVEGKYQSAHNPDLLLAFLVDPSEVLNASEEQLPVAFFISELLPNIEPEPNIVNYAIRAWSLCAFGRSVSEWLTVNVFFM